MRREGPTMRCYYDPPLAQFIGTQPSPVRGAKPLLVVAGLSPEVTAERFCRHHPMLREALVEPKTVARTTLRAFISALREPEMVDKIAAAAENSATAVIEALEAFGRELDKR
jgi:hypothetical protein